ALRTLRKMDADDGAGYHAERAQHIGEAIGRRLDLGEAPRAQLAVGLLIQQRRCIGRARGVIVADSAGDVEPRRHLPSKGAISFLVGRSREMHVPAPSFAPALIMAERAAACHLSSRPSAKQEPGSRVEWHRTVSLGPGYFAYAKFQDDSLRQARPLQVAFELA